MASLISLGNPVRGTIHVDAHYYPKYTKAWHRPGGNHEPAVNHDFGPSTVVEEHDVQWPGGETNIYGTPIPADYYKHFHLALDIEQVGCGFAILAADDGVVVYADSLIGGSRAVVIRHAGGVATGVSHLASITVKQGQKVKRGQKVGTMGQSGNTTGCHVHFAVKVGFSATLMGIAAANAFYNEVKGFKNPWPLLAQNQPKVSVRPNASGVNIRSKTSTDGNPYATTKPDGTIRRFGTNAKIGLTATWRKGGSTKQGEEWKLPSGATGTTWEPMVLGSVTVYLASALADKKP